ncbi:hypothetical protein [Methylobacillus glycogenes]|uniref:hypothetical protein n=1 Tax=Methylobacillus glycogenes TaxID=406 RepID=UPI0004706E95|nr:hypothetical protein [Methylobacillus glycogenes]
MEKHLKIRNTLVGVMLLAGVLGCAYTLHQLQQAQAVNQALRSGGEINNEDYALQRKFAEAYFQGAANNYKHAVQNYSQLLESADKQGKFSQEERAQIYFNIGNNLFRSGLIRLVNPDGELQDEAKYAYAQGMVAYEQALRLAPELKAAKFNLSLLHAVIPHNMQIAKREQSGMELSNLPIGLP